MIEQAIKISLERLSGMTVYPLLLPDSEQNGITFQRISDPEVETGMVRTGLIAGRFQISMYKVDDYTGLVKLDKASLGGFDPFRQKKGVEDSKKRAEADLEAVNKGLETT